MSLQLGNLSDFRKALHKNPELSDQEEQTAFLVKKDISQFKPNEIVEGLGGHGIAFIFNGRQSGPTVMFRSELDALPINEINEFNYRSTKYGVSHKCGHDRHMAIVDSIFLSASIGLIIRLKGKTSDASEPEKGQNPVFAVANVLKKSEKYALPGIDPEKIKIITSIYCRLGEQAFGINPGYAEMMFTLRAAHIKDFQRLNFFVINTVQNSIKKAASSNVMHMEYEWVEEFANTQNESTCNNIILKAAKQSDFSAEQLLFPFRWSEDFGHFLEKYPGALFGLGAGIN